MGKYLERTPNFFMDLFVKQEMPCVYNRIQYLNYRVTHNNSKLNKDDIADFKKSYSVSLIPSYCFPELKDSETFGIKTLTQFNVGYAILINKGFNIDIYLKKQFKSNYRNLKKRHQRLESCFNVHYKFFYGNITKETYLFIMESLKKMLVERFTQRKDKNKKLEDWDELVTNTYNQIIEKKASLFIIYDDEMPIDISLNYHFDKIMFGAISSYALEYHKFGMGSIEKIKLLEWCLSNDYKILDFGFGDLEYKKKWSNNIYRFKSQVIYNRKSIIAYLFAKMEILKLSLKEFLKSKKADVYYKKLKSKIFFNKGMNTLVTTGIDYERTTVTDLTIYGDLKVVAIDLLSSLPIKLIVNDFLYTNIVHKDHIVIQEVDQEPGSYIISGKNISQHYSFMN